MTKAAATLGLLLCASLAAAQTYDTATFGMGGGGGATLGTTLTVVEAGGEGGPLVTVHTRYGVPYGIAVHVALVAGPYGVAAPWETVYGDTAATDTTYHFAQEYASFTAVDFDTLLWVVTLQASDTEFHREVGSWVIDCVADCLPPILEAFGIVAASIDTTAEGAIYVPLYARTSELPVSSEAPILVEWQVKQIGGEYEAATGISWFSNVIDVTEATDLTTATFAADDSIAARLRIGDVLENWSAWGYDVVDFDRENPPNNPDVTPAVIATSSVHADSFGVGGAVRLIWYVTSNELAYLQTWWKSPAAGARTDSTGADTLTVAETFIKDTGISTADAAGDSFYLVSAAIDTSDNVTDPVVEPLVFVRQIPSGGEGIVSVTGAAVDGGSIVIAGAGFGVKSPAAPMLWETFDAYGPDMAIVDDDFADHGWFQDQMMDGIWPDLTPDEVKEDNADRYTTATMKGSGFAVRSTTPDSNSHIPGWSNREKGMWRVFPLYPDGIDYGEVLYVNFSQWDNWPGNDWIYENCGQPENIQWKAHRVAHLMIEGQGSSLNEPEYRNGNSFRLGPPLDWTEYGGVSVWAGNHSEGTTDYTMRRRTTGDMPPRSAWFQSEWTFVMNSANNTADGSFRDWQAGDDYSYSGFEWCAEEGSDPDALLDCTPIIRGVRLNIETLGLTACDADAGSPWDVVLDFRFDNFYADITQQRVMIANAAIWSETTKRHPQPPTAWADDEITVTFNIGDAESPESWWWFVILADGTPLSNTGYPLTWPE